MFHVFSHDCPEVLLTKWNGVIEAFTSNGADEALSKGVQVGTVARQLDHLHAGIFQDGGKVLSEEWIPVLSENSSEPNQAAPR